MGAGVAGVGEGGGEDGVSTYLPTDDGGCFSPAGWLEILWGVRANASSVRVAIPFVFHVVNGTRMLCFDMALGLTNAQVRRSGWVVVGLTTVISLALVLGV